MRAARFRFSAGADGDPLLVLLSEEGSSVCVRLAPALIPGLGEALLAEHRRQAKAEETDAAECLTS